MREGLTTI